MAEEPSEYSYGHEPPDARPDRPRFEEHVKSRSTWLRLVFMILMAVFFAVTRFVLGVVVVVQFLHVLFTGAPNSRLRALGASLAAYVYEIIAYLTFNSDTRPFPFDAEWPSPHVRAAHPPDPPVGLP